MLCTCASSPVSAWTTTACRVISASSARWQHLPRSLDLSRQWRRLQLHDAPRQHVCCVSMFDLLISGGQIIDGTGSVGFYGAVAVEGETVHILRGDVSTV